MLGCSVYLLQYMLSFEKLSAIAMHYLSSCGPLGLARGQSNCEQILNQNECSLVFAVFTLSPLCRQALWP
jgi:hypothetical protein